MAMILANKTINAVKSTKVSLLETREKGSANLLTSIKKCTQACSTMICRTAQARKSSLTATKSTTECGLTGKQRVRVLTSTETVIRSIVVSSMICYPKVSDRRLRIPRSTSENLKPASTMALEEWRILKNALDTLAQ